MNYKRTTIGLLLAFNTSLNAITFDFAFDNNISPGIQAPLVGSGLFSFSTDPGDGIFAFSDLGVFSMTYSFVAGPSFTEADIASDLNLVRVVLSTSGAERRLQFSDTGAGGGGPLGGSLDLVNAASDLLSFEPSSFGDGLRLYFAEEATAPVGFGVFGDYLATAAVGVPEGGSTLPLFGMAVLVVVFAGHLRRKAPAASQLSTR